MTFDEACGIAAQAWCTPETEHKVMDVALATAFANLLIRELDSVECALEDEEAAHADTLRMLDHAREAAA